jgi:L-serine dehydratase
MRSDEHDPGFLSPDDAVDRAELPAGVDRRAFMMRSALVSAVAVYLCKHNATLSGAEGGCQAEIGVASAMGVAFIAQAHDYNHQVIANAAESSLRTTWG